jgi:small conductance mechanosensitive channel
MITAGGVTGNVREIGLFVTTLDTADNVRAMVGNNKIFSDTVFNYSFNSFRRVDLHAQIAHGVDPQDAIARLKARIAKIPNIVADPSPSVEILEFNLAGPVLAVRPFCHNNNYWGVYFATNAAIAEVAAAAGFAVPEERRAIRQI